LEAFHDLETIGEGKDVLLYLDSKRQYLVKVKASEEFHTHKGVVKLKELVGKPYGVKVESSLGVAFYALKPLPKDYAVKFARRTQIIYPKDMALLVLYAGVGPGSRVVEAGTGSAALTSVLAYHVKPSGHVYSYEIRGELLKAARRNLERAGIAEYVTLKEGDVTRDIEERDVDAVVLDLATPWLVVENAWEALKPSGVFASFSPTIEQVVKTVETLKTSNFADVETVECFIRRYQVETGRTRPETLTIAHTGYLTFARKTLK
jgi:tRNA (adenine57-N1/adenine58-N1)-methyltransferase